jgi:hypothetical protein
MGVVVFFVWIGVCALVSWLTAFQMPDGYGNAIFLLQIVGAVVSGALLAMGLPTAIDPKTKVVVSGSGGGPNYYTTWPRRKGVKLSIIGGAVFVVTNVGGWYLDVAMGLPYRHAWKVQWRAESWAREARPELDACLATFWTRSFETCQLRYRVTRHGTAARLELRKATCPSPPVAACLEQTLSGGTIYVEKRQLDSVEFAGAIEVDVSVTDLHGTGAALPAERQ